VSGAGTSLVEFKIALFDLLAARPGLANVKVKYGLTDGEMPKETIILGHAETDRLEIPTLRAGKLHLQEEYDLNIAVQVCFTGGQSERQADVRAVEIFAELQQQLAEMPQIVDAIQWARPESWRQLSVPAGTGHASLFEIKVRVHARME